MKLTRRGECALLGLIYLVKKGKDSLSYVREVAEALNLPQKLLAQVFYSMARGSLLKSYRGRGGGFTFALPAEEITVRDVIEAVQGKPVIYHCVAGDGEVCNTFTRCSVQEVLNRLQEHTMDTLGGITLDNLAEGMVFK